MLIKTAAKAFDCHISIGFSETLCGLETMDSDTSRASDGVLRFFFEPRLKNLKWCPACLAKMKAADAAHAAYYRAAALAFMVALASWTTSGCSYDYAGLLGTDAGGKEAAPGGAGGGVAGAGGGGNGGAGGQANADGAAGAGGAGQDGAAGGDGGGGAGGSSPDAMTETPQSMADCDLVTSTGCPAGTKCSWEYQTGCYKFCGPIGSKTYKETCVNDSDCGTGMHCYVSSTSGGRKCNHWCKTDADCSGGVKCQAGLSCGGISHYEMSSCVL